MQAILDALASLLDMVGSYFSSIIYIIGHLPRYISEITMAIGYMPEFLLEPLRLCFYLVVFFSVIKLF